MLYTSFDYQQVVYVVHHTAFNMLFPVQEVALSSIDITKFEITQLNCEISPAVIVEPLLQPLTGEKFKMKSAIASNDAKS